MTPTNKEPTHYVCPDCEGLGYRRATNPTTFCERCQGSGELPIDLRIRDLLAAESEVERLRVELRAALDDLKNGKRYTAKHRLEALLDNEQADISPLESNDE